VRQQPCGWLGLGQRFGGLRLDLCPGLATRDRSLLLKLTMQLHSALVLALGQPARMLEQLTQRMLKTADPRLQKLRCRFALTR
jgi:hypothetical protein